MSDGLKEQVVEGTKWNVIARVGEQLAQFVLSVVLARLLLPEHFGAVGMVAVFTGFVNWIADMGLSAALVQRQDINEQHVQSVFWLNIATAVLFTTLLFVAAPLISRFYDLPLLMPLTRALSLTFLISAPGLVPAALLQRQMNFRALARTSITSTVLAGLVGVSLAVTGAGVWSLAAQSFVFQITTTVLNILSARWRPRLSFSRQAVSDVWHYSFNLLGYNTVNYWARSADNMLIGRFFGSAALGYYSRSYALMLLPVFRIVNVIAKVMFPALSSIQDDTERVKRVYLRTMSVIALIVSPMMLGLIVTAEPFVLTVYGEKWVPMIPLLRILAGVGLMQALTAPGNWFYVSLDHTDWMFRWGLVSSMTLIASIVVGVVLGSVQAVAWSYAVANLVLFYPAVAIPSRLVGLHFRQFLSAVLSPLLGSLTMVGAVILTDKALPNAWRSSVELSVLVLVGVLIYLVYLQLVQPKGWQEVVVLIMNRLRPAIQKTGIG